MNRAVPLIALILALSPLSILAQKSNVPPVPNETKKMTFGNVAVTGHNKFSGNFREKMRFAGSNTLVTVTDKPSRSLLKLHADTIELKMGKKEQVGVIDMTGNVRFNAVQTLSDGTKRTLDGTASNGVYSPDSKTIELNGRVNATFTDESRLAAPGTLKASKIKVNMSKQPYTYEIIGGSETELIFAPLPNAKATPETAQVKQVKVSDFASGTFKPGEQADFKGSATVAELDLTDGGSAKMEGDSLEASFGGDKSTLTKAEAQGNARYSFMRPAAKEKREETAKGSSASAVYSVADETMTLNGKVDATIIAPESLQSPARLLADRVTFRTQKPYRYEITSTPDRALLKFAPLPPKDETPAPNADSADNPLRSFVAGEMKITNFAQGIFEPEKLAKLSGGKPIFESSDPETKSSTRLQAAQLTATYSATDPKTIGRTEATGGVTFAIVQPKEKDKQQTAIRGKAEKVVFLNAPQMRRLDMTGPLNADVVDPTNLVEPGKVTGGSDVILSILFVKDGYDFEIESPKETAVLAFKPREAPKEDEKKGAQSAKKTR